MFSIKLNPTMFSLQLLLKVDSVKLCLQHDKYILLLFLFFSWADEAEDLQKGLLAELGCLTDPHWHQQENKLKEFDCLYETVRDGGLPRDMNQVELNLHFFS